MPYPGLGLSNYNNKMVKFVDLDCGCEEKAKPQKLQARKAGPADY